MFYSAIIYKLVPVSLSTVAGCIAGKVTVTGRKQRCQPGGGNIYMPQTESPKLSF